MTIWPGCNYNSPAETQPVISIAKLTQVIIERTVSIRSLLIAIFHRTHLQTGKWYLDRCQILALRKDGVAVSGRTESHQCFCALQRTVQRRCDGMQMHWWNKYTRKTFKFQMLAYDGFTLGSAYRSRCERHTPRHDRNRRLCKNIAVSQVCVSHQSACLVYLPSFYARPRRALI